MRRKKERSVAKGRRLIARLSLSFGVWCVLFLRAPQCFADAAGYCGAYALFGALHAEGVEVEFKDLLQPEYIGSRAGSTLGELAEAAKDHGAHADPLTNLSVDALCALSHPAILHVTGRYTPAMYNHWILYLGTQQDKARVFDSAVGKVELYPPAELLARWDGTALVVSAKPVRLRHLFVRSAIMSAIPVFASALCTLLVWTVVGSRGGLPRQVIFIMLIATLTALVYHFTTATGMGKNNSAVRAVALAYRTVNLPTVTVAEVIAAAGDEGTVLIDARYPRTFKRGHIPTAINVPVDMSPQQRRGRLEGIDKSSRVIVYCQSEGCGFDETVGTGLVVDGFENVSLFAGGWIEWQRGRVAAEKGKEAEKGTIEVAGQ